MYFFNQTVVEGNSHRIIDFFNSHLIEVQEIAIQNEIIRPLFDETNQGCHIIEQGHRSFEKFLLKEYLLNT